MSTIYSNMLSHGLDKHGSNIRASEEVGICTKCIQLLIISVKQKYIGVSNIHILLRIKIRKSGE